MDERVTSYVDEVIKNIVAEDRVKEKIKRDLYENISDACENSSVEDVLNDMGDPEETAENFMDAIYDKSEVIEKLIKEKTENKRLKYGFEYKSKVELFGVPLVHIRFRGRCSKHPDPVVTKGIIALGDISIGVISLGGIAIGVISMGALSLGLIALGALSAGLMAYGGMAIGLAAFGGIAIGKVAFGGLAIGKAAVGGRAIGKYIISGTKENNYSLNNVSPKQVEELFAKAYPNMSKWVVKFFTLFR